MIGMRLPEIAGLSPALVQPAVIAATIALLGTLVQPWISSLMRAIFGGRLDAAAAEAKRIDRFYTDMEKALQEAKTELRRSVDENLNLRREMIHWEVERARWDEEKRELRVALDGISEDVTEIREAIADKIGECPQLGAVGDLAMRILRRARRGKETLFEEEAAS